MKPLAASVPRFLTDHCDHFSTDSSMLAVTVDHRVLNPDMTESIPQCVDKTNQSAFVSGNNPPEAVPIEYFSPVPLVIGIGTSVECFGVKSIHLGVLELTSPLEDQRHVERLSTDCRPTPGRRTGRPWLVADRSVFGDTLDCTISAVLRYRFDLRGGRSKPHDRSWGTLPKLERCSGRE